MKSKVNFLLLAVTIGLAQLPSKVFAQPPDRLDRPNRQFLSERRARILASLSEDERSRLRAAHQKAMMDPGVQAAREKLRQARREFREILRPALLKADPSIQPILDKLRTERPERSDRPGS